MSITFVTVVYNTKELLEKSYNSIKKFYPFDNYLIIDGSDMDNECYWYAESLNANKTEVYHAHRNIGHGSGMHLAMRLIDTQYVVFYDSDIVMNEPCVGEMISKIHTSDVYGIGKVHPVPVTNFTEGTKVKELPNPNNEEFVQCLHPAFCVINRKEYHKHAQIISNAAPFVLIWLDMFRKGEDKFLFIDFPIEKYVTHRGLGTREDLLRWHELQGHIDWQLAWNEYVKHR